MRKLLKWGGIIIGAFVLVSIGVAIGGGGSTTSSGGDDKQIAKATVTASSTPTETPEPEPTEPPKVHALPDPKGTFNLNCDYVLGDFSESSSQGFRFIAGGRLRNTGNIGIVTRVTVTWEQLGQAPIKAVKTVSIKRGHSKRVSFSLPATSDQIDLHQSSDGNCDTKVKILDEFGKTPLEDA